MLERVFTGLRYFHQEYTYNNKGQKIGYVKKRKSGDIIEEAEFEYWSNGNLKYEKTEDYRGRRREIFYNKQGDPKSGFVANNEGEKIELEYELDYYSNGNKKNQVKKKVHNGKVIGKTISKYNSKGEETEYIEKHGTKIMYWYKEEYDNNGNLIKFISKNKNGKIEDWKEYKYDQNGNKIEFKRYYMENGKADLSTWKTYEYTKNGQLLCWKKKNDSGEVIFIAENKF